MTQLTLMPSEDLQALRADIARLTTLVEAMAAERRPEWLTPEEAAKVVGRTPATVRQWAREGKIETRRVGRRMMVKV